MGIFDLVGIKKRDDWDNLLASVSDEKIKRILIKVASLFFRPDKIDPTKFKANYEILRYQARELYKSYSSLKNEPDLSDKGTKTIDKFAFVGNRPLGYESWFIAAYPDVVNWFQDVEEPKALGILGNPPEKDLFNEDNKIKVEHLRKIVDAFINTGERLETTITI